MKAAKTPQEYYNYFRNLVFFPDASLTKRTFDYVLSPAVKGQDVFYLGGAFWNYATQEAAWEMFKTHFQELVEKGGGSTPGAGMVRIANAFCDEKLRDDSQTFLAAQNLPGTQRVLENAKDRVNACIQIRSLQQSNLNEYLKKSWVKGATGSSH